MADKIIEFPSKAQTASDEPSIETIDIRTLELHPDFGDVPSMWNMRMWLQKAIEAAGAKQDGAGMGMGEADIDFSLEGHRFNVRIKPLIKEATCRT